MPSSSSSSSSVFYDVDPSDVRKQKGDFGKGFSKQEMKNVKKASKSWRKLFAKYEVEDTTKVESWKKALVDASNISGWEPQNVVIRAMVASFLQEVDSNLIRKIKANQGYAGERRVSVFTRKGGSREMYSAKVLGYALTRQRKGNEKSSGKEDEWR
ncbi:Toll/interleukin-1 receptor domain-containing protein [Tanacetum coccineum]